MKFYRYPWLQIIFALFAVTLLTDVLILYPAYQEEARSCKGGDYFRLLSTGIHFCHIIYHYTQCYLLFGIMILIYHWSPRWCRFLTTPFTIATGLILYLVSFFYCSAALLTYKSDRGYIGDGDAALSFLPHIMLVMVEPVMIVLLILLLVWRGRQVLLPIAFLVSCLIWDYISLSRFFMPQWFPWEQVPGGGHLYMIFPLACILQFVFFFWGIPRLDRIDRSSSTENSSPNN